MISVAQAMKERRIELSLKVKEIAPKIGVAESAYRDWENGRKIQGEPYINIARALDMSVLELLEIEGSNTADIFMLLIEIEKQIKIIRRKL